LLLVVLSTLLLVTFDVKALLLGLVLVVLSTLVLVSLDEEPKMEVVVSPGIGSGVVAA
jgi:hypothetical protein